MFLVTTTRGMWNHSYDANTIDEAIRIAEADIYVNPEVIPEIKSILESGETVTITYGFSQVEIRPTGK
jgi:hypothetical protein